MSKRKLFNRKLKLGFLGMAAILLAIVLSFAACDHDIGIHTNEEVVAAPTESQASRAVSNSSEPITISSEPVTITGTAQVWQTLTANTSGLNSGDAPAAGTVSYLSYQWKSNGVNVGSNQDTYYVQRSDFGKTITVTVTASGATTWSVTSAPTAAVVLDPATMPVVVDITVKNGGDLGLNESLGVVSSQNDDILVKDSDSYANDFSIRILVPWSDSYVNFRWEARPTTHSIGYTLVKAKIDVSSRHSAHYAVTMDYNGGGSVSTSGVYDVKVGTDSDMKNDFSAAWNRATQDS